MTHIIVPDCNTTLEVSIRVPDHGWIDLNTPFNTIIRVWVMLSARVRVNFRFADELSRRGHSSPVDLCRSKGSV
eukprot:scaffold40982_cov416-Skeletonema_marinoi.AAC.1